MLVASVPVRCNIGAADISSRPFEGLRCVYTTIFVLSWARSQLLNVRLCTVKSSRPRAGGVSDAVQAPAG